MGGSAATVGDIGEAEAISLIAAVLGGLGTSPLSGPDDATVLPCPLLTPSEGSLLVVTTDMLVGKTDAPPQMTLYQVGHKAAVMNVSDLLVKGAVPQWAVVALGLPRSTPVEGVRGLRGLVEGLRDGFAHFRVSYVGGDLNEAEDVVVSPTVFGWAAPGGIIPRAGARPGDLLITTGEYGWSGLGLAHLVEGRQIGGLSPEDVAQATRAVLEPTCPADAGRALVGIASASMDSSDGLAETVLALCEASGTDALVYDGCIPRAECLSRLNPGDGCNATDLVLSAGEEFHQVFCVPAHKGGRALQALRAAGSPGTPIGQILGRPGPSDPATVTLLDADDQPMRIYARRNRGAPSGFAHFRQES
jgi:thiamine-monophosphate kinase